jgi:hypothetical protein
LEDRREPHSLILIAERQGRNQIDKTMDRLSYESDGCAANDGIGVG